MLEVRHPTGCRNLRQRQQTTIKPAASAGRLRVKVVSGIPCETNGPVRFRWSAWGEHPIAHARHSGVISPSGKQRSAPQCEGSHPRPPAPTAQSKQAATGVTQSVRIQEHLQSAAHKGQLDFIPQERSRPPCIW